MVKAWIFACAILATLLPKVAIGEPISLIEFEALALKCAPSVSFSALAAIATVESQLDPLAIHDNETGKAVTISDATQAAVEVDRLLKEHHSIDVELMQINSANFASLGLTSQAALDPCSSLRAAGVLLRSRYVGGETPRARKHALRQTISAYNTGDVSRGLKNGYVGTVEMAAKALERSCSQIASDWMAPISFRHEIGEECFILGLLRDAKDFLDQNLDRLCDIIRQIVPPRLEVISLTVMGAG